jgi:hypothetical protein
MNIGNDPTCFNTSIDIAYTQPALDGLARVLEKWIAHFPALAVRVSPMVKIEDEPGHGILVLMLKPPKF